MSEDETRLAPEALYTPCDPGQFPFKTTAELDLFEDVVGQERAVSAVRFAMGMRHSGYNLFALGPEGTGKYSLISRFLENTAAEEPVPSDWCYVNNFVEAHRPRALRLPAGRGRPLKEEMERLVEDLRSAIPVAFESDEYRNRKNAIEEQFKERNEEAFNALQKSAQETDATLVRTPVGLAIAPVRDGEVMKPQDFDELPKKEKKRRVAALDKLQHRLEETLADAPKWEKEQRHGIRDLDREVTGHAVSHLIDEVKKRWSEIPGVKTHLEALRHDVIENADDFLPQEEKQGMEAIALATAGRAAKGDAQFRRYRVNVLVDNSCPEPAEAGRGEGEEERDCAGDTLKGAPVVHEDHPTQPNLIGRIEHLSQFGAMITDFTLIKAGALHRANGGYIILDARKLLVQPVAWDTLKRALRSRRIRIESPAEAMGWAGTQTLEPEPIPLEVKVVLVGEPELYYLLSRHDPEFGKLFKVAADFDSRMERNDDNALQYAQLVATLINKDKIKPLDRKAMARVVEHGARLADDAEKLTTHMGSIVDLVREADYWADEAGSRVVRTAHIQRAIDAKIHRSDRLRERIQEEIQRHTLVIQTDGQEVGQVNGLSVLQLGHFSFGRPSRISCRVRIGQGKVVDIEREVELGGPLHSKGVLILSSFLSSRYAGEQPLSLAASLVFEQSYGGIDGDSASSAELYALLSALSGIPIRQSMAVTGSVDQLGRVQAIGGVNEKIEGFFDVCEARGLTGDQAVLIPAANVKHLMLRGDVVEAVTRRRFHVHAVATIDQGIEVLTGVPAGEAGEGGAYPIGSVNRAVVNRLEAFARKARQFAGPQQPAGRGKKTREPPK